MPFSLLDIEVVYRRSGSFGAPKRLWIDLMEDTQQVTRDVKLEVQLTGNELQVSLTAFDEVVPESCVVRLRHEFAPGEELLMNGYQTWTDTVWRDPLARMRGLRGIPRGVVRGFALDGIGDYRFCHYDGKPGHQHGWTYACVRNAAAVAGAKGGEAAPGGQPAPEYTLVGSLDESQGFLQLRTEVESNRLVLRPEVAHRSLAAGESRTLLQAAVLRGASERDVFRRWFAAMGVRARDAAPLVGYSSWYRHYDKIDEATLVHDLAGAKDAFAQLEEAGLDGRAKRVFQVDDGWCTVGDWLWPDREKFPLGMQALAARIRETGFVPGLWMSPFVCSRKSRLYAERPEWLLRDEKGNPQSTGSHWGGAFALDVLNPEVQAYVRECLDTAVNQWGFDLLKLDFLYGACLAPAEGYTRGEVMAAAMALIRETVGEDCLIDGCGVPLGSAFGVVDYCRIGCDVGPDWDDKLYMRPLHRERVSTKNAIGNIVGRAALDGLAFGNDPDVIFLRADAEMAQYQKIQLLDAASHHGSMLLTSDDMALWTRLDRAMYLHAANAMCERVCGE